MDIYPPLQSPPTPVSKAKPAALCIKPFEKRNLLNSGQESALIVEFKRTIQQQR